MSARKLSFWKSGVIRLSKTDQTDQKCSEKRWKMINDVKLFAVLSVGLATKVYIVKCRSFLQAPSMDPNLMENVFWWSLVKVFFDDRFLGECFFWWRGRPFFCEGHRVGQQGQRLHGWFEIDCARFTAQTFVVNHGWHSRSGPPAHLWHLR